MWIMTPYGFFSVVCAHGDNAHNAYPAPPHPELMMIRARNRNHLEALKKRFAGLPEIDENSGTDYLCRITAPRAEVLRVVATMADDVDYTNFKSEAHKVSPNDKQFHTFLMSIWHLGLKLTPGGYE